MKVKYYRDKNIISIGTKTFYVTCVVRNELNGWRALHSKKEVVHSVVNGQWGPPYMPRQFPKGNWQILTVEETDAPEFAPIKITTNAKQEVTVWALDKDGGYDHPAHKTVIDSGYHFHWSEFSRTTLGCGRVGHDTDAEIRELAKLIKGALILGETVELSVI